MSREVTRRALIRLTVAGLATTTLLATGAAYITADDPERQQTSLDPLLDDLLIGDGALGDPLLGLGR